jgi:hypothetical protein
LWGLIVSVEVLKDIREELRELRLLYKDLVEKLMPIEGPAMEEKRQSKKKMQSPMKEN